MENKYAWEDIRSGGSATAGGERAGVAWLGFAPHLS
jgi:hypothetical protein